MTLQSNWQFTRVPPDNVGLAGVGYYAFFLSDGSSASTGTPTTTIAGALYKKDWLGNVTAMIPAAYNDEQAQDAVGTILTDTATIDFTYDDAGNTISAIIKANSVTNAMLVNVASSTIRGRVTAGTGSPEDLTGTQATSLLDVATTSLKGLLSAADKVSLNAIKAGIFNPYDYGVVDPTGAVSSNAAFAAAVAALIAAPRGGVLVIPVGVFGVNTGTIDFSSTSNPVAILGEDRALSVLVPTGTGDVIKLSSTADGSSVQNFAIFSSGATQTAGNAINTNGCDDVLISNMLFNNQFVDINIQNTSIKVNITHCVHTHGVNNGANSIGIQVTNGAAGDTYIGPDVVMSDTGSVRRAASVNIVQSGHYEITQSNLTGSTIGILINPGTGSQIVAFGFHNQVLCDSCFTLGMLINPGATGVVKSIKSVNSWYSGTINSGNAGVIVGRDGTGAVNGVTHIGDRFLNNSGHGYQLVLGTDTRLIACDFKGNGSSASNTYDGLQVAAGVSNWSVLGGKFGGNDGTTTGGQQRYGINVLAGAGDNIKIVPDDCLGNLTAPMFMGATGTNVYVGEYVGGVLPQAKTAATGIISSASIQTLGTFTIPAGSLQVGDILFLQYSGTIGQTGTTAIQSTFTLRCGAVGSVLTAVVVGTLALTGPAAAATSRCFTVQAMARVVSIGASGTMIGTVNGDYNYFITGNTTAGVTAAVTVDTTTAKDIAVCMLQGATTSVITGSVQVAVLRKMK